MGKGVGIYTLVRRVFLSLASYTLIPLGSLNVLALKLAPSMCWNLPAALFNDPADVLYVASIFSSKGLRLLWLILEFCMGQGGSLSKWPIFVKHWAFWLCQ
ncbi:unnamed protein product [Prunus brigantina]